MDGKPPTKRVKRGDVPTTRDPDQRPAKPSDHQSRRHRSRSRDRRRDRSMSRDRGNRRRDDDRPARERRDHRDRRSRSRDRDRQRSSKDDYRRPNNNSGPIGRPLTNPTTRPAPPAPPASGNNVVRADKMEVDSKPPRKPAAGKDAMDVDEDPETARMRAVMGFTSFNTTKNKQVPGNNIYYVRKEKKTEYRQYMNRVGGFNRPLSPSR